ncbi:MAG TPA: hypothetical protein VNE41_08185 [Chitinophagaceae bacterium]|nr:hypothetical protein [Chitinophagaceae bacterium]
MKKNLVYPMLFFCVLIACSCNKWANDQANIYKYILPSGKTVSPSTPLGGPIKGVMLTGNTYTIDSTVYINKGDTLMIQPGVTLNFLNSAGLVVRGVLASIGTKAQPIFMTVPGVEKNTTPGIPLDEDSAHIGLWRGIICDTSCTMCVLKWTHIDFAGASYGNVVGPSVNQSAGTSFNILFQNPNGDFIMEDSWLWGGTDDGLRISSGKIFIFRNTFEKNGGTGGDIVNVKGGTVGTMAYNFFIGTAYNGQKASNKGQKIGSPETDIVMYNSTFVNCGIQVIPGQRGSTIDFEEGAEGAFYNNVSINCRVGYRVVNSPAADTANLTYGNNYQWADSVDIANQFFTFGPVCTKPQSTDLPDPTTYLPADYSYGELYDGSNAVQKLNPLFINYPLPVTNGYQPWDISSIGNYNFHLQPNSPLIGKGDINIHPLVVVPIDPVYGATEVTPPGSDLGCYQINGQGNQH